MRTFTRLVVSVSATVFISVASARTASCPCNPCRCSPCVCGGGTGSSSSKPKSDSHGGKNDMPKTTSHEHDHRGHDHGGHGGGGVGVGVNVDLSGIGHRQGEPDPFAVSVSRPTPGTVGKHKTPSGHHSVASPAPQTVTDNSPPPNDSSEPKTEEKPAKGNSTLTNGDGLKQAEAKYKEAKDKVDKAQKAFDEVIDKYFGADAPSEDQQILKDLKNACAQRQANEVKKYNTNVQKAQEAYQKFRATSYLTANGMPLGRDALEWLEAWDAYQGAAEDALQAIEDAKTDYEKSLTDMVKQIDAQQDTHLADDLESAKAALDTADDGLKQAESTQKAQPTEKGNETKQAQADPPKKP